MVSLRSSILFYYAIRILARTFVHRNAAFLRILTSW